jgi:hypothetical protein
MGHVLGHDGAQPGYEIRYDGLWRPGYGLRRLGYGLRRQGHGLRRLGYGLRLSMIKPGLYQVIDMEEWSIVTPGLCLLSLT